MLLVALSLLCWLRNSDYELVVRSLLCVCDVVLVVCFGGVVFIVLVVQSLLCVLVVLFLFCVGGVVLVEECWWLGSCCVFVVQFSYCVVGLVCIVCWL